MVQTDADQRMGLNLNLSVYSLQKPLSQFLYEVSSIKDNHSKLSEIDAYVGKLEEERNKIDVFKRELPLSMLLLNEAIGALKEEARKVSSVMASNGKFNEGEGVRLETDKKSWMSSAQSWISNTNSHLQSTNEEEEDRCVAQNPGGAFLPFNHLPPPPPPPPARLSLMTPTSDMVIDCGRIEQNHYHHFNKASSQSHHIQKKEQRRKWSQDLHRKFVDALRMLGGPQVATPRQIREMMKVDGLTNDEVKSHLQKYRMHIRKHPLHPARTLSSSDQPGELGRESQSLISLSRSDSPQSPLVERELFSNNFGHSSEEDEEEEEKSDGRSCRSESKKKRQVLDLEL